MTAALKRRLASLAADSPLLALDRPQSERAATAALLEAYTNGYNAGYHAGVCLGLDEPRRYPQDVDRK
jgi:hypothetical protein